MTAFLSAAMLLCALALAQVQPWARSMSANPTAAIEEERGFLGVFLGESDGNGVTVSDVIEGGAAERAGLQAGDVIQGIGDAEISNLESLQLAFSSLTVGSRVNVTFRRDDRVKTVKVKLGKRPEGELIPGQSPETVEEALEPVEAKKTGAPERPGFLGVELSEGSGSVSILNVVEGSPAANSGLESGDVIVAIEDQEIAEADQVVSAIQTRHAGDTVRITVMRDGARQKIKARLGARDAGEAESEFEVAALDRADVEQEATDRIRAEERNAAEARRRDAQLKAEQGRAQAEVRRAEERAQREAQAAEREAQAAERTAQQAVREAEQVARRAEAQARREADRSLRDVTRQGRGAAPFDSEPGLGSVMEELRGMREELRALRREVERNTELLQALLSRQSTSVLFAPGLDSEVPATWLLSRGENDDGVLYEIVEGADQAEEENEVDECSAECCSDGECCTEATDLQDCDEPCDTDESDDEDHSAADDDDDDDDDDSDDDEDGDEDEDDDGDDDEGDDEDGQDEDMPN